MVKKVFAAVVVLLAMVSGAWAEVSLWSEHASIASLKDGKSDYSSARFFHMWLDVERDDGTVATEEYLNASGTMIISGGDYSFVNKGKIQNVRGASMNFTLAPDIEYMTLGRSYISYNSKADDGNELAFVLDADGGMNGVNVNWAFPSLPSMNGQAVIPNYRTTQEQLDSFVPYVEYIQNGSQVTGLRWRVVSASDTSIPVSQDFGMALRITDVYDMNHNKIFRGTWNSITGGQTPEGTISFNEPIDASDIWGIRVSLYTFDEAWQDKLYDWYFYNDVEPYVYLWRPHDSRAELINGKSDYRNAEFVEVDMYIEAENIIAEAKHFTDEGHINIPGGGYVIVSDDDTYRLSSKVVLGTVESGNNKTFGLRMHNGGLNASNAYIGTTWAEYEVTDDSGRNIAFAGGAETGLNGRTVTWTFPADLGFNGNNNTLPDFKSTAEQLAGILPYVEIVSADGKLTAINYRLVTSNDTSTALTPSYRTDFRIYIGAWDEEAQRQVRIYRGSWQNEKASGTIELSDEDIAVSEIYSVQVRLRSHEDSRRPVYIWHFFTASVPSSPAITTSSLPNATVNTPYTTTLATNIPGATWSISSGTLPTGLTLNPSTGTISGTPIRTGITTFLVRAESGTQSAQKQFSIKINAAQGSSSSSGGGCSSFPAIFALALAFILSKKH